MPLLGPGVITPSTPLSTPLGMVLIIGGFRQKIIWVIPGMRWYVDAYRH